MDFYHEKIDLHIHTIPTINDRAFEFSMDVLVSYIQEKSLDAIAITNHNLFDQYQYESIVKAVDIPVFPGIEIDVENGHLLLLTAPDDIDDFVVKCQKVKKLNSTSNSTLTESQFLEIFSNLHKYLLIPHYDKNPKIDLKKIPLISKYIVCGEVSSSKKFINLYKNEYELVPLLFSDLRIKKDLKEFPDNQTYVDIEDLSINALKLSLCDREKVALNKNDGNRVFQILDNGLKISSGLTVVLGGRSSGKTHTLDQIYEKYKEEATYIRQFELITRDEDLDKKRFDELLRTKGDSVTQAYLQPLKKVINDVSDIDLISDEQKLEDYIEKLKSYAFENERKDIYSKTRLFDENLFETRDLSSLVSLIDSVEFLITNKEYKTLIETYIPRHSMLKLIIKLIDKFLIEHKQQLAEEYTNNLIQDIKDSLGTFTTNTSVPYIDLYKIALNRKKIEKFNTIVEKVKNPRVIEERQVGQFKVIATARPFKGAQDLHAVVKTREAFQDLFDKYDDPYSYLCCLKRIQSIPVSDYYKFFTFINFEVLNASGTKVSGGERSEFNLLQKIKNASQKQILILDEPESSFDNLFLKEGVNRALKEISKLIPVVIATHNNTIGASVNPDYLIYAKKEELPTGRLKYHLYSGYPSSKELVDLEGNRIERREVMLDCLEAGEQAYCERSKTYEVSFH